MQCPEHHTGTWIFQGLLRGAVTLVLQGSLEAPAQVSEVYCAKNRVRLLLKFQCTNKLLAKLGWDTGSWSAVVGLWGSIFCGLWVVFSPLVLLRSTSLYAVHLFRVRGILPLSHSQACSPCFQLTALCSTVHRKWCLVPEVFLTKLIPGK